LRKAAYSLGMEAHLMKAAVRHAQVLYLFGITGRI
jgi:hypothetical protein